MSTKTARDKIRELRALHDDGLLTQHEFDQRKNAILDAQLSPTGPARPALVAPIKNGTELGLLQGQEIGPQNKRYRLENMLGQGGMGQVWLATDLATHAELGHSEKVALKILPPQLTQSPIHAKLLVEEATQARKLAHEHIVRVYEWAQDPATTSYFIIMEYLEGQDFDSYLAESGPFSHAQVQTMLAPVAQALRYAWEKHQLVHRDIKPGNLFLTRKGEIKLLDFGIAARVRSAGSALGLQAPANAGTAGYRAPEAGARQRQPSPRLDVYALAVMIYQLIEGELPFGDARTPQHAPSAPEGLNQAQWLVLQKGFAFAHDERPTSVLELLEGLEQAGGPSTEQLQALEAEQQLQVLAEQAQNLQQAQQQQAQQEFDARERELVRQQAKRVQMEEVKRRKAEFDAREQVLQVQRKQALLEEQQRRKQEGLARTEALRKEAKRLRSEEQEKKQKQQAEAEARADIEIQRKLLALEEQKRRENEAQARLHRAQVQNGLLDTGAAFRDRFLDGTGHGPLLVVLPSGRFLMGSTEQDRRQATHAGAQKEWVERETPQHWVSLDQPFAIGKHPLTVGEWRRYAQASGWQDDGEPNWASPGFEQNDEHPVVCISWEDVQGYLVWLSEMTGHTYRLPSEAEWEYACRAGTETAFSFGDTIDSTMANYDGNFTYNGGPKGEFRRGTTRIGSYAPNAWGLHDMHGNVWEWVQDVVHEDYYGGPLDGSAWVEGGNQDRRVLRGGCWLYNPRYLRSALRNGYSTRGRNDIVGVRIARVVDWV
jgi:formylglycine-generating enzyme required for sulfatase activity/serine/threonine protein kinase